MILYYIKVSKKDSVDSNLDYAHKIATICVNDIYFKCFVRNKSYLFICDFELLNSVINKLTMTKNNNIRENVLYIKRYEQQKSLSLLILSSFM